ncbi:NAD-dependent epimerase/dehydratase family protein [Rhodospirillum sp. A1_3_36]|uniref:NAD-dependent epimerase/dehydratase family protein n=1 Tax=Rhodospirillum sp. A1_3_36 TaxID=3391666 RepID=UPI0039A6EBC6
MPDDTTIMPGQYSVLGASGLLGSHLLSALANRPGVQVRAVVHHRAPRIQAPNITPISLDLTDPDQARAAMQGADFAVIAAGIVASAPVLARDPVGPVLTNLRIATNALEAAWTEGVARCLLVSSTTGYPALETSLDEDQFFVGAPPPGWAGLGQVARFVETQAHWFAKGLPRSMHVAVIRPTLIYGEYDHFDDETAHFLPAILRRVVNRETPIEIWGTGEQTRDLVHGADVARAALLALATVQGYRAWTIGAGEAHSVNACLNMLLELDGFSNARIVHRLDKPSTVSRRRFDTRRANQELGFRPALSLRAGLRRTLEWYHGQGSDPARPETPQDTALSHREGNDHG